MDLADPGEAPAAGRVLAVRMFGPTRRADIVLTGEAGDMVVEAAVPPGADLASGREIGLVPRRYRLFPSA